VVSKINSSFKTILILLFLITIFNLNTIRSNNSSIDYCEVYGEIIRVIDGDTVELRVREVYSSKYVYLHNRVLKIRFADINAPELDTHEGVLAKEALINLLNQYGWSSCLNIDDCGEPTDRYGRYIAVVFVKYNSTHWLNVNKWLLDNGYAEIMDFHDNEFNPYSWTLYVVLNYATTLTTTSQNNDVIRNWFNKLVVNPFLIVLTIVIFISTLFTLILFSKKSS